MNRLLALQLFLFFLAAPAIASDMEITPFRTVNQSPLAQIHGIPAETSASITPAGHTSLYLTQDVANNFVLSGTTFETLKLDGESFRWVLALRHGLKGGIEVGGEIPWIVQGGGFHDGFLENYHRMIGYSGDRSWFPKDRFSYRYSRFGQQKLSMTHAGSGIGDISLFAGMKLYDVVAENRHDRIALRANLKLPTGSSADLYGNGGTDVAMLLSGSTEFSTRYGTMGVFGSAGVLGLTGSQILKGNREYVVGHGTVGVGWSPNQWISFKVQLNVNTPFYSNSDLGALTSSAMLLTSGGSVRLPGAYQLDIGVGEDVAVNTAPDVTLHLGLSKRF